MSTPQPPDCWLILVTPTNGDAPWWLQTVPSDRESAQVLCDIRKRAGIAPWQTYTPVRMVPAEVQE